MLQNEIVTDVCFEMCLRDGSVILVRALFVVFVYIKMLWPFLLFHLRSRKPVQKPYLNAKQIQKRLSFCKKRTEIG